MACAVVISVDMPSKPYKTSLTYWFPRVSKLGIPVPRTKIIPIDREKVFPIFDGDECPYFTGLVSDLMKEADKFGFPLFLRTDLSSEKHSWKNTCYVPNMNVLSKNLVSLLEFHELAGLFGLPYEAIVFREFLDLEISFKAFRGEMPINRERRYFVRNGKIECHHPYWPEEVFNGQPMIFEPGTKGTWKERLAILNNEPEEEISFLTPLAEAAGAELGDYWSIDFAKAKDGTWYLIDMALGNESYHWEDCPHKK